MLAGPGVFCVGYTMGTGAVTKLLGAGAEFRFQVLWVLPVAALLFLTLIEGMGRYAAVTGGSALHGFCTHLRGGRMLALLIMTGVVIGQWTGLPVLVRLVSQLIYDAARILVPSAPAASPGAVIAIAATLLACVFMILSPGRFLLLEKVMMVVVALMLAGFIGALLAAQPAIAELAGNLTPSPSSGSSGPLSAVAVIGTAMAAPTFLLRPLLVKGKGWNRENLSEQRRDAVFAALLILVIGTIVVAFAAGLAGSQGESVWNLFDAAHYLENSSGRLAAGFFILGAIGAGVSSIIPIVMILPVLVSDYGTGQLQFKTRQFRPMVALACVIGLAGTVFGDQLTPMHRLASQVAQVFVLPLVVGGAFLLLNKEELMGAHKAGIWLNAGLAAAFGYSLVVSWLAVATLVSAFS